MDNKRTVGVTLKLSDTDLDLFRRAGEALYGKDHPIKRSTLIRELAKRGAQQAIEKKSKPHSQNPTSKG